MDTLLTLANIHPRDRVAYWHDVACKTIIKHDRRVPASLRLDATIECMQLGELGFVKVESFGLDRIERTARHIAQGDDNIFLLCVKLRGAATLSQDGPKPTCVPAILPSSTHGAPTSATIPTASRLPSEFRIAHKRRAWPRAPN